MNKILSLGDFFMFGLEDLKKINQKKQESDRIDHENIEHTIDFFDKNNIAFFRADVILNEDNISFKQTFLDKDQNEISVNGMFGNEFLLHLHAVCPMIYSHNEPATLSLETPVLINDLNFYDGDLYCIPLSSFSCYDQSLFTDEFNQAILNAKEKELTHLVFQINFLDTERQSAGDDITSFNNKDPISFNYSDFNFTQNPFVRLFFTNKFGECHFNLEDVVKNEDQKNDDFSRHAFYSEAPNKEYMKDILDFISTLNIRSLHQLLQNEKIKESMEFIGNFRSEKYNYISTYNSRNLFKQHQISKMTHLNDVKAIFINKNDLPKTYNSDLLTDTTHLVFLPIDNLQHPEFKQIFKVEAVLNEGSHHYNETKKEISIFEFNQIISQTQVINIVKKSDDEIKNNLIAPLFFPFGVEREIDKTKTQIEQNIEFGNAYTIPLSAIKSSISINSSAYQEIEYFESLGVSDCITHASFPYHFLLNDDKIINNDRIYFDRERHLEFRVYPLKKGTFEFLDLDAENYELRKHEDIFNKGLMSAPNIKLTTGDSLNVLREQHLKMNIIEERKNPFFKKYSVLTRRMLKMYNDMLVEKNKLLQENKTQNKPSTLKI